ncbi:MAG TPA: hypothetical protein VM283_01145, partial [Armatimonadota bacterium]|nr:hypothetical protein [Armatimonadota bacterium]
MRQDMNRLVVTNSALSYPAPPQEIMAGEREVLPLVERFEEALFMPSEWYEGIAEQVPELNRRARACAANLAAILPPAVSAVRPRWGHSPWDVFAATFVKFSLGPLLVNQRLLERAVEAGPEEVVAWDEPGRGSWWAGQQSVHEFAAAIASATGARLRLRHGPLRRAARRLAAPLLPATQVLGYFVERMLTLPARPVAPCDVIFAVVGPTLAPLFERIGTALVDDHGLRVLGVEVPLNPGETGLLRGDLPHTNIYAHTRGRVVARGMTQLLAAPWWQHYFASRLSRWPELAELSPRSKALLARRMHGTLTEGIPVAIYHSRLWQDLLDATRPAAVVSFNSYSQAVGPGVLQANHRGLATICCQHGIWGPYLRAATLLPYDDVCVFGEYAREMLSEIATGDTTFHITGHALYDYRAGQEQPRAASDAQPMVLVTTQPIGGQLRQGERGWWVEALAE